MDLTTFSITSAVIAVYVYFNFFMKKNAKHGYVTAGIHAIRKDYKFVKVEFRSLVDGDGTVTEGFYGFINTQNPFFISNLSHFFDSVQNDDQSTILKKSTMRLDSPDFDKWLKTFDESIIQLELVRK